MRLLICCGFLNNSKSASNRSQYISLHNYLRLLICCGFLNDSKSASNRSIFFPIHLMFLQQHQEFPAVNTKPTFHFKHPLSYFLSLKSLILSAVWISSLPKYHAFHISNPPQTSGRRWGEGVTCISRCNIQSPPLPLSPSYFLRIPHHFPK